MAEHGITWDQVRIGTTGELAPGVTWVAPRRGTDYLTRPDGTVESSSPLDGVAWTVSDVVGGKVTAQSHEGRRITDRIDSPFPILLKR